MRVPRSQRVLPTDQTIIAFMILWRRGMDTLQIAQQWFVIEPDVCRILAVALDRAYVNRSAVR